MKKLKYLLITIVLFVSIVLTTHFSEVVARAPEANAPGLGRLEIIQYWVTQQ